MSVNTPNFKGVVPTGNRRAKPAAGRDEMRYNLSNLRRMSDDAH